jgi:hypothetical protein
MTDMRPDRFTEHVTKALQQPANDATDSRTGDAFAEALRRDMEASMRPVVDQVLAKATRPWKRAVFWLGFGYLVLGIASVLQWVTR